MLYFYFGIIRLTWFVVSAPVILINHIRKKTPHGRGMINDPFLTERSMHPG